MTTLRYRHSATKTTVLISGSQKCWIEVYSCETCLCGTEMSCSIGSCTFVNSKQYRSVVFWYELCPRIPKRCTDICTKWGAVKSRLRGGITPIHELEKEISKEQPRAVIGESSGRHGGRAWKYLYLNVFGGIIKILRITDTMRKLPARSTTCLMPAQPNLRSSSSKGHKRVGAFGAAPNPDELVRYTL